MCNKSLKIIVKLFCYVKVTEHLGKCTALVTLTTSNFLDVLRDSSKNKNLLFKNMFLLVCVKVEIPRAKFKNTCFTNENLGFFYDVAFPCIKTCIKGSKLMNYYLENCKFCSFSFLNVATGNKKKKHFYVSVNVILHDHNKTNIYC